MSAQQIKEFLAEQLLALSLFIMSAQCFTWNGNFPLFCPFFLMNTLGSEFGKTIVYFSLSVESSTIITQGHLRQ